MSEENYIGHILNRSGNNITSKGGEWMLENDLKTSEMFEKYLKFISRISEMYVKLRKCTETFWNVLWIPAMHQKSQLLQRIKVDLQKKKYSSKK